MTGTSYSTWGSPLNPYIGSGDAFVARIEAYPSLRLSSPNGGEIWPLGSKRNITWAANGISSNVKLVLFKSGVKVGNIIVDIPANSSPYNWTVGSYIGGTAVAGDGYIVRVISMDGVCRDDSDGPFVIQ